MPRKTVRYRADIIQAMSLATADYPLQPDDPFYDWRLLAEGDSWWRTVVLNLGYPGDTIANVAQLSTNTEFARRLAHPNWASDWDAVLLSGGGNDLIERAPDILRATPAGAGRKAADYVDAEALAAFKDDVQAAYRRIVALRDADRSPNQGKPIIVHTYDYPTPRPAPATFLVVPFTRPWMHPIFQARKV